MAGGIGSRFWPASRTARPKQFLDILGIGKSLLRLTFERFLKLVPAENIFIVTHEMYFNLTKEHLPELTDNQIICEPSRNNTAPCVAYTSFKLQSLDPDANIVFAPSDHLILKEDVFIHNLQKALDFAADNDALLTLGIQPTRPDTGYGYIHFEKENEDGVHKVLRFVEKPPLEKAVEYVQSGEYLWNGGIFIWNVNTILSAFKNLSPDIYHILSKGARYYNTMEEQEFVNLNYPLTPSISVDYAILEKSPNVYTIPTDMGWSDLGTWASLHVEREKDMAGNVIQGKQVLTTHVSDCLIRANDDKLVVINGLHDYIVVDEEDVLLIFPKSKEQEIKKITQEVEKLAGQVFL